MPERHKIGAQAAGGPDTEEGVRLGCLVRFAVGG